MKGLLLASRKVPVNWGSDQQPGHGWQHRWGWQIWYFPPSVLIWQHWGWLCCWGRGRGGRRICPNVWQNCSSLWNKSLKHVPKHRILPTAPTTFSCSLSGSCALPEPHFPDALGTQTGSYRPSTPPQYSWNSFPRWRQRKKTIRGKKLWSYHQKWPQKKKKMELENFCTDGELYLKALHPLFMMGIFLQGIIRRKLVSSAEKLGKHQGRPVSLFHTAGFSAAQVFFPLALGPSKDECWISLSITHRLICY